MAARWARVTPERFAQQPFFRGVPPAPPAEVFDGPTNPASLASPQFTSGRRAPRLASPEIPDSAHRSGLCYFSNPRYQLPDLYSLDHSCRSLMTERSHAASGLMALLEFVDLLVSFLLGILHRLADFVPPLVRLVGGGVLVRLLHFLGSIFSTPPSLLCRTFGLIHNSIDRKRVV